METGSVPTFEATNIARIYRLLAVVVVECAQKTLKATFNSGELVILPKPLSRKVAPSVPELPPSPKLPDELPASPINELPGLPVEAEAGMHRPVDGGELSAFADGVALGWPSSLDPELAYERLKRSWRCLRTDISDCQSLSTAKKIQ